MGTRDGSGKVLSKDVLVIPGIGSYEGRDLARESSRRLKRHLSHRLDEMLGTIEWLRTDFMRKRAMKHAEELDELSSLTERVSRRVEWLCREHGPCLEPEEADERLLNELFQCDKTLEVLLSDIEKAMKEMTDEKAVPTPEDMKKMQNMLASMEEKTKESERLLKGHGGES